MVDSSLGPDQFEKASGAASDALTVGVERYAAAINERCSYACLDSALPAWRTMIAAMELSS